jgi:hypothetical protein
MTMKAIFKDDNAVSVIIGAMLLILITVVAAASLAVIVSEAQKKDMERKDYQSRVDTEQLKISSIDLYDPDNDGKWNSIDINVMNLNIDDSNVIALSINDKYALRYVCDGKTYDVHQRLLIPAASNKIIKVDLINDFTPIDPSPCPTPTPVPYNIANDTSIKIKLITSYINEFNKTYKPPNALSKVKIESEYIGVADRDYLMLDGSESYDDGQIVEYIWNIEESVIPHRTYDARGKNVQFISNSCGPLKISLTVKDDTGMISTSKQTLMPYNPRFNPPMRLTADVYKDPGNNKNYVRVQVFDIEGTLMDNVVVNLRYLYGNVSLEKWSLKTGEPRADLVMDIGTAYSEILNGSGSITVFSGKLPTVDVVI